MNITTNKNLYSTTTVATNYSVSHSISIDDLPKNMKLSEAVKLFEKLGYKLHIEFKPKVKK